MPPCAGGRGRFPILQGEARIAEAMAVAEALSDAEATANCSCGYPVHFDASDFSVVDVKAVVRPAFATRASYSYIFFMYSS